MNHGILAAINSHCKTLIVEKIKIVDHIVIQKHAKCLQTTNKKGKQNLIEIKGKESLSPLNISIPGDPSSASFWQHYVQVKIQKVILETSNINLTRTFVFLI